MREMNYSGVPWIGEIPNGWQVRRIKTIFSERTELSETGNETLMSVSEYYGVDSRSSHLEEDEYISRSESLVGYKKCYPGDLVSNIMLAWKGSLGVASKAGIVSPAYCVYMPLDGVHPRYYHYLFRTSLYTGQFKCYSKGIIDSRLRLYSPFFYNIPAIIPPVSEQQLIANYLDTKCAEIDAIVEKTKSSIEEYGKLKQAVITDAITKGIRGDRPMKESGVEWIGEIPEKWKIHKTLSCLSMRITDGPHSTPVLYNDGIPFVSAEAISMGKGSIDFNHIRGYVSKEFYEECCKKYIPQKEDIYMIKSGATTGRVSIVDTDIVFTIWSPLAVFRCNKAVTYPRFLFYALQGEYFQKQVSLSWSFGTQQNIGMRSLEQLKVIMPPVAEQQEIATYLDEKCTAIDSLIASKEALLAELEAYKKSLIYEYVTGKKEVM